MSNIKYLSNTVLCSVLLFGAIGVSMAQTQSTNEIRGIGTGYAQDQFIAYAPIGGITAAANPAGCANLDGYGAKIDYAGYKTHLSTVQLAFALGKPITVTVSNVPNDCMADRPRIIGVSVFK
jgi:hypothetical protein